MQRRLGAFGQLLDLALVQNAVQHSTIQWRSRTERHCKGIIRGLGHLAADPRVVDQRGLDQATGGLQRLPGYAIAAWFWPRKAPLYQAALGTGGGTVIWGRRPESPQGDELCGRLDARDFLAEHAEDAEGHWERVEVMITGGL